MLFSSKKNKENKTLKMMNGREIKYVTRRDENNREVIVGKTGRIVVIDDEIRIMCGVTDVFICDVNSAEYYTLLSGDGICVSGNNRVLDSKFDKLIVYYTYYRK